ncbi:MAG: hypothetical protein IT460_06405 [Planctomycetes bacterium]|nr:hypothetical protein [Planctomycetota bacterium]
MRPLLARAVAMLALLGAAVLPGPTAAAGPDPVRGAYDEVLAAWKAKRWDDVRAKAAAFLEAHADYVHAHSARFMAAQAAWSTRRYDDVLAQVDRYLADFPAKEYADRLEVLKGEALFKLRRGPEAKAVLGGFVERKPGAKAAAEARTWLARIDPADRTVRGPVVLDYDGKYAGDPAFLARVAEVERLVPEAVARSARRLGLAASDAPPFRVRFADTGERPDTTHMETREELHGAVVVQALVVRTEALMARLFDVARTLTHELVHVRHRHALGEPYYGVPKWAREGLAVWAAEQGPTRLPLLYNLLATNPKTEDAVARLVNGLRGPHTTDDYGEDWLAFRFVEETKGADAVGRLVRRLLRDPDVEAAFAEAAGTPFPAFEQAARAWAQDRVRRDLGDREAYLAARRAAAAGTPAEAVAAFDAFLAAHPAHALASRARYDRAAALFRAGRLADAAAAFDALERDPLAEIFRDDVAEHRVRVAAARGDAAALEAAAKAFVRDFSWVGKDRLTAVRALWTKGRDAAPPVPADKPDPAPARDDDDPDASPR